MNRLEGKVAIVTGAGSEGGIGFAIALMFSGEGARITIADVDDEGGRQAAERIRKQEGSSFFLSHRYIRF